MRSRDLRITSFIVVFPIALILLSLCTILCIAIASQIKSLYPSLFSTPRAPATDVYESLAVANPSLSAHFPGPSSRKSSGTSLTLRSLLSGAFLLCVVLYLLVLACRLFHKLRTRHALDSCLEKLAEYRIPGTMYINPKKVHHLSRWSPFSSSLFPAPPPATPSPPLGSTSWLLSRSGNGSLSLHSPEDPHGSTTFVSALSSTLASSKPYYRFDSSSSNHSSSSHLYIPEQQLHDHLLALEEAPSVSQLLDRSSSDTSPVAQSSDTQDAPPIASAYEPLDVEEGKPRQPQQPESQQQPQQLETSQQQQVMSTKEPQPSKKAKAKKKQHHPKLTKQQQQQHVSQKDVIVIPAPATEPPQHQQKRTTSGASSTRKKREQKRLKQPASKEAIQQQSQRLPQPQPQPFEEQQQPPPTPEPSPPEKPQHRKETKQVEKQQERQPQHQQHQHTKPTQQQQSWYSPFSTGLEIDIMPRSPSMRRYTLFGDPSPLPGYHSAVPPAAKDEFGNINSSDSSYHHQFALPSYGGWPMQPQRTGQISPLSASPPSPPIGMAHAHRQFRPFWPGRPPQDTTPMPLLNRAAGSNVLRDPLYRWPLSPATTHSHMDHSSDSSSNESLPFLPKDRTRPFVVESGNGSHFSLFSNDDDHLCFH